MIKNENFVIIQGWMINELQLKEKELMVYALIYGFSQTDECKFTGSLSYIAEWIGTSKRTVFTILKNLCEKNLLIKDEEYKNNIKFCSYHVKNLQRGDEKIARGDEKISTNNINIDINKNIIKNTNYMSVPENLEQIKPIDPYTSDLIEKVFDIYTKECNNLCPLGGYARKNRSLREAISGYMWQTNNDINYFTSICKKANELKIIADKKIDLKMILNCYEGIDNGKYIKTETEEWSVNDLFKKEEK